VLSVQASQVNRGLTVAAELLWNYADSPFVIESRGGLEEARTQAVVSRLMALDLLTAITFLNRVSIGLDLPLFMGVQGDTTGLVDVGDSVKSFTVGDLRLSPKVMIIDNHRDGVGFAFEAGITAPTAQDGAFTGEDSVTLHPRAIVDWNRKGIRVAVNLGYRHRFGDAGLDILQPTNEITFGAGGVYPFLDEQLEALAEMTISTRADAPLNDSDHDRMEFLAGARWHFDHDFRVTAGAGLGVLPGYGNAAWRVLVAVAWSPRTITPPDTDLDGIPDFQDKCPREAEDLDGYMDFDGCPDWDNDLDGVPDAVDECPSVPEDRDGFSDDDGCPETDNDGDGIEDGEDICRNDPEDHDGFQDEDGCPEPDNDLDGILDADDACPNDAETRNGYQDNDGCPDQTPLSIVADKVVMVWPVEFVPGTATLMKSGYDALERMAAFLIDHQELTAIRVDAHTDDKGSYRKLYRLSEKRARVVGDTLDKLGVAYFRMFPKGFGSTVPIAPNDTEEGRKQNNRIEFTILERND
jgi:outer membrane protein OmpA-like peptidoglycan-associated protein